MEGKEILESFDETIGVVAENVQKADNDALKDEFNIISKKRHELKKAVDSGDDASASAIISELIEFGKKVEKGGGKKCGIVSRLFGGTGARVASEEETKKWVIRGPAKDINDLNRKIEEMQRLHEMEIAKLEQELAESRFLIEGLKGSYAKMSKDVGQHRRDLEKETIDDVVQLKEKLGSIKKSLDEINATIKKEMETNKDTYSQFGREMLYLATKISQLEGTIDREEVVTDVDIIMLRKHLFGLENRLAHVEAREKAARARMIKELKKEQKKVMDELSDKNKAATAEYLEGLGGRLNKMAESVEQRQAHLSAEVHKELKDSYAKLVEQLWKLQDEIKKATGKKSVSAADVNRVSRQVKSISKAIDRVERGELPGIDAELKGQRKEDQALEKRIKELDKKLEKIEETLDKGPKKRGGKK